MGQRIIEGKKDADKDRAKLIDELNALRDFISRLNDIVERYKNVAGKNDPYRSIYDLEIKREGVESLCEGLREKDKAVNLLSEDRETLNDDDLTQCVAGHTANLQVAHQSLVGKSRFPEAFFNHTLTPLVLLDRDFNFIRVNEAYARACQKDVDEFPGHNHFEFYPSDAMAIFEDVVRTRQPFQVVARPFVFPDHPDWGVTYWNWMLTPLLDDDGEIEVLVFSLEDVTELKKTEFELGRHR
ncbi:MAG TPA: PAS domain-containing protein, partial [Methanocella sp.]